MPNTKDDAPDVALEASNERGKDAVVLSPDDAILALTGGLGAPPDDQFLDDDDSLSSDAEAPQDIDFPEGEYEGTEDDSLSDTAEDSEPEQTTKDKNSEEGEPQEEESEDDLGDLLIGLDDAEGLHVRVAEKPADGVPTPTTPTGQLTETERTRLWQAKANKFEQQVYDKEKALRERDARIDELERTVAELSAKQGSQLFDKRPNHYMPPGEQFIPEDRDDVSTPSGQAYLQYVADYRKHEKEALMAEIEARQEMKRRTEAQKALAEAQVATLRSVRKGEFMTQDDIDELISWTTQVGPKGLLYISYARDIANGTFRLPRPVLQKLAAQLKPKPSNGKASVATLKDAEPAPRPKIDPDRAALHKAGFLDA